MRRGGRSLAYKLRSRFSALRSSSLQEGNRMKASFLALVLFALLGSGARDLGAQPYPYYDPYWDLQYQQYLQYQHYMQWQDYLSYLQQTDPYYDLHVMHYQLYRQFYQPYQIYQPCCYAWSIVPQPVIPIGPEPRRVIPPRGQAVVGPLPPAVAPLPRAASPLPHAAPRR